MTTLTRSATEFLVIGGVSVATRTIGSGPRLILLHRFRGTLDDWDPAFVLPLAEAHEVMMFDSIGIGQTDGVTPISVEEMADFAARVIGAEGSEAVDVLGWSLGGLVAQVLAIKHPELVRKLVLAGTMPSGGTSELTWSADWLERASARVPSAENALALMYTRSETSQAAGKASLARLTHPPAAYVSLSSLAAQADAIQSFVDGEDGNWYKLLTEITAPTLVTNGDRDALFPAIDSVILAAQIPESQLAIYPDSGHAFLFQYAERFAGEVRRFLEDG